MSMFVFVEGFLLSLGLIVALGPQNAFVLRQGVMKSHALFAASVCFVCDAIMIALGVMGVGRFVSESPELSMALGWGGVLFLLWFASRSLLAAYRGTYELNAEDETKPRQSMMPILMQGLAFSLLNPWAYLDTMVLIGGVSVRYETDMQRLMFLVGAVIASAVWFYGLSYGSAAASRYFRQVKTWRVLDCVIAAIMLVVAANLVSYQLSS